MSALPKSLRNSANDRQFARLTIPHQFVSDGSASGCRLLKATMAALLITRKKKFT